MVAVRPPGMKRATRMIVDPRSSSWRGQRPLQPFLLTATAPCAPAAGGRAAGRSRRCSCRADERAESGAPRSRRRAPGRPTRERRRGGQDRLARDDRDDRIEEGDGEDDHIGSRAEADARSVRPSSTASPRFRRPAREPGRGQRASVHVSGSFPVASGRHAILDHRRRRREEPPSWWHVVSALRCEMQSLTSRTYRARR